VITAPTLSMPGNGAIISDNTPTFEWSSTVAGYQLEYATDNMFTTNVAIVKDLTTTSYTPATPLAGSTWYWHVRSGDDTTSVGLWSDTWQFTIAETTWTGTAVFGLENLWAVRLEKILDLYQGSKLVVKFYFYDNTYENEVVIENFTPPWHVEENEIVPHPTLPWCYKSAVKKAKLDLTADNTENVISTIATFTTTKSYLIMRISAIKIGWPFASPAKKSVMIKEISDIKTLWPYDP